MMIFSEQAFLSLNKILGEVPFNYSFKIHGSYRYPVYPNWKSGMQKYHDLHILYVWGGQGFYKMKDGNQILLEKGSLVFISNNFEHTAGSNMKDPLKIQGLRFGIYDRQENDTTNDVVSPFYFYMKPENTQYYDDLTLRIHKIHNSKNHLSDYVCSAIIYQLLFELFSALQGFSFERKYDKRIKIAKEYIDENPFSNISMCELADKLNITARYLQKKFKQEVGYTPKEYELYVKMNTACSFLENENIKVKDVANLLGYSDQYAFSRQFHKHFGFSPSQIIKFKRS